MSVAHVVQPKSDEEAKTVAALRHALGEDQAEKLMQEGTTWSEEQAIAEAMLTHR